MKQERENWLEAWPYGLVALAVLATDQFTKWLAVAGLTHAFDSDGAPLTFGEQCQRFLWQAHPMATAPVSVLEDFWHFRYVENPGAAWGFLSRSSSGLRTPFFLVVSVVLIGFIVFHLLRRTTPEQRVLRLALALVLGGALGNFFDRSRLGYVIDFIDWHWYDKATWPTFNVADAGISVGVALILFLELFVPKAASASALGGKVRGGAG